MKTITIRSAVESLLSAGLGGYQFFKTRPNNLVHDPENGQTDLPACAIYFESGATDDDYLDETTWSASIHVELFQAQDTGVDDLLEADAQTVIDALNQTDLNGLVEYIRSPKFTYNRDPETDVTALDLTFTLQWEE